MDKIEIKENDLVKLKSGQLVAVLAIREDGKEVWGESNNKDVYFAPEDIVEIVYKS